MAHFAEIDDDGRVLRVLVVPDEEEHRGQQYLADDLLLGGKWVQTSYNRSIRMHFAGIGYRYDAPLDAFIPPQPFASWVLDHESCEWRPPFPAPSEAHTWNEEQVTWMESAREPASAQ